MFYDFAIAVLSPVIKIILPSKAYGRENVPEGGAVIAGNHTSNADSVIAILALPFDQSVNIIAKEELFKFKPLGWFLSKMGAFPVARGKNDITAIKKCISTLKEGKKLLIFPEGTRVHEGEESKGKTGAVMFAMRTKTPVVPMYITPNQSKLFTKSDIIFGKPYYIEGDYKSYDVLRERTDELMKNIMALGEKDGK